jgi:hypothetical protein
VASIAPSTLDQRLRFYAPRDTGAGGHGRPVYDFTIERWGRVDPMTAAEVVAYQSATHTEYRIQSKGSVAIETAVPNAGLVRVGSGETSTLYWVRGVVDVRVTRRREIALERIEPTAYEEFFITDTPPTTDGLHLIYPSTV